MRKAVGLVGVLLMILAVNCAMFGGKPWADRTAKEKSSYFMALYNRQYDDTMAIASNPNITEAQRKVVRTKKDILSKLWPAIQTYDAIAAGGGIPSFADEQAILDLINRLVTEGG